MAKSKKVIPPIEQARKTFSPGAFLPVYLFYGPDTYTIDIVVKEIEKAFDSIITSDFDKEVLYGDNTSVDNISAIALSFPFGSEKKLVIVKEWEKLKDKKNFGSFFKSPPDHATLILIGNEDTKISETEPYKSLVENGYAFEAKELKDERLVNWVIEKAAKNNKKISSENASLMINIAGEKKDILEAQLEKIFIYLNDKTEIDHTAIIALSAKLKEYTIFDLQNAIGRKQKDNALKIALNMLDKGEDIIFIIAMLTKYFASLSRVNELGNIKNWDGVAARILGTHPAFIEEYKLANSRFNNQQKLRSVRALFNADLAVKTSQTDSKTIVTILISEILS